MKQVRGARGGAGRIKNDQRGVHNEEALLAGITELLKRRGRGERLLVYKSADYPNMTSIKSVMSTVSAASNV